jgi:F0F1-type ATP synthase epsilon subunit
MNGHFDLEIISPTAKELLIVDWVEVQGISGSFLVGPDHSPLVSIVAKGGQLVYKKHEAQAPREMHINSTGIFKVGDNKAVLLLDS